MEDTVEVLGQEMKDRRILVERTYAGEVPLVLVDEVQVNRCSLMCLRMRFRRWMMGAFWNWNRA